MRCVLLLFGLLAASCKGNGSNPDPQTKADPWAATPNAGSADTVSADPWASGSSASANEPPANEPRPTNAPQPTDDPPPTSEQPSTSATTSLDGHWACQMPTTKYNAYTRMYDVTYVPAGFEFWLDGDRFKTRNAGGTFAIANRAITFQGGDIDGWRAALNTHSDGRNYIVFRKDRSADPHPGETTKFGDYYCAKQSS